jgi:hypothetical protein
LIAPKILRLQLLFKTIEKKDDCCEIIFKIFSPSLQGGGRG